MAKVLQNRATEDETKMANLADELKKAQNRAEEADRKYDEAQKKAQNRGGSLNNWFVRGGPKFSTKSQLKNTSFSRLGQHSAISLSADMSSSSTCSRWSSVRLCPWSLTRRSTRSL